MRRACEQWVAARFWHPAPSVPTNWSADSDEPLALLEPIRMDLDFPSPHLGQISTPWTLLRLAHADSEASGDAKRLLVQRYGGAVYRYLLGALRDEQAALELFQEFALRFLRGDFHRADAEAGRFRDYLRGALIHLVTDYHRQRRAQPRPLPGDIAERA